MSEKPKRKRSLLAAMETIERYHRRRMVWVIHLVASLAFQVALWANWFGSYAAAGRGFDETFFTDRITIAVALVLLLAGHALFVRLAESKDRLLIEALRQHRDEVDAYEDDTQEEDEDDAHSEPESAMDAQMTDRAYNQAAVSQRKRP